MLHQDTSSLSPVNRIVIRFEVLEYNMNRPRRAVHLSEAELARIILTVPSISDRARIWGHIAVLKVSNDTQAAEDRVVRLICGWIERTWPEQTVRAKMARKVSGLIRDGSWRS